MINAPAQSPDADKERSILLRLLFDRKQQLIVEALRERNFRVSKSITLPNLRARVEDALDAGELTTSQILDIVNDLEGWGNQQIYLYQFSGGITLAEQWKDEVWVRQHFDKLNKVSLLNAPSTVLLPDDVTLVTVKHFSVNNEPHVRFVWVEKRTSTEPAPEHDVAARDVGLHLSSRTTNGAITEQIIFKAFREITVRGIIGFDWNIAQNAAMLTIYKHTGADYLRIRDDRLLELEEFLPVRDFRLVPVSSLVARIRQSDEAVRRELVFQTVANSGRFAISSGNQDDLFLDTALDQSHARIEGQITGLSGNLRWKLDGWTVNNHRDVGIEVYGRYAEDQRIGIGAEETEENIRYVLRRIRTYCT